MLKLAANLSLLFPELPFLDRYRSAREAGFNAVECLFPYEEEAESIASVLAETGMKQVLFNAPPGDWAAGERGIAALPGRVGEFRDGFELALRYATILDCHQIHVMAGIIPLDADKNQYLTILAENLAWASEKAASQNITILLESLNEKDVPGYLYSRTSDVAAVINQLEQPNIKLQLDLYHRQMTEGRLVDAIDDYLPIIGHIQIAGVPGRGEPSPSEINIDYLFDHLERIGYEGWVGCEYHPTLDTLSGLNWAQRWLSPQ